MTPLSTNTPYSEPCASIIIPAYNEESVIGRCLAALLDDSAPGEFDIVVVCNGCSDDTAAVARRAGSGVRVFESEEASKTEALNLGDRMALTYPRVYLDADLEVSAKAVRSLTTALLDGGRLAAIGFMDVDLRDRPRRIRRFYMLWMLHPYLRRGKFGGIYALTREGCARRGPYPAVVADDTFVRERFRWDESVAVEDCRFKVFPPRTIGDIIRIRSRAYLGNLQLRERDTRGTRGPKDRPVEWLRHVALRPKTWIGLPIYLIVNVAAKIRAARLYHRSNYEWQRDESSRDAKQTVTAA